MKDKLAMGQCTSNDLPLTTDQNECVKGEENCNSIDKTQSLNGNSVTNFQPKKLRRSRRSLAASWVTNKLHRKQERKDLSAAFNLMDHDTKSNLVNINVATEEELMTLSGITRQLAKNIVDYRNTIGGFRRIEDLALVSGIGASMLQCITHDITLKKLPSHSSSRAQSCDSIPSCESLKSSQSSKTSPLLKVNVNSASIFDLMMVRGMTQEMAANIVHYRSKRGPFAHIEELNRVRGINSRVLRVLRGRLTCNNEATPTNSALSDSLSVTSCGKGAAISPIRVTCHRRTQSAPLDNNPIVLPVEPIEPRSTPNRSHRFSSEFSADLFELLSLRSERPHCRKPFEGVHNGTSAIRVGSWNVQQLSVEKVNNPGVLEVICRTVLETGFSILALQEVISEEVLSKICGELNEGSLRRIKEWSGPRGDWEYCISQEASSSNRTQTRAECVGFLYNRCHGVRLDDTCLLPVHNNNNSKVSSALIRKPFIAYFTLHNELSVVLVNLQLQSKRGPRPQIAEEEEGQSRPPEDLSSAKETTFSPLIVALRDKLENDKHVALLGNFVLHPNDKIFEVLHESCYMPVIPFETPTDISYDNPKGSICVDNFWLSLPCQSLSSGSWGVIREGLSHMAIPRGWGWGGMVSDHCPIFCDLYAVPATN